MAAWAFPPLIRNCPPDLIRDGPSVFDKEISPLMKLYSSPEDEQTANPTQR